MDRPARGLCWPPSSRSSPTRPSRSASGVVVDVSPRARLRRSRCSRSQRDGRQHRRPSVALGASRSVAPRESAHGSDGLDRWRWPHFWPAWSFGCVHRRYADALAVPRPVVEEGRPGWSSKPWPSRSKPRCAPASGPRTCCISPPLTRSPRSIVTMPRPGTVHLPRPSHPDHRLRGRAHVGGPPRGDLPRVRRRRACSRPSQRARRRRGR